MFVYSPCEYARKYMKDAKVNDYPESNPQKPEDCENKNGVTITRGYLYPQKAEIVYKEKIESGTEYVGVLLIGENFKPVWVGNRIELSFLYKNLDYKYILKIAEKYISKTIFKTFDGQTIEKELKIKLSDIQSKDFFVK